MPRITHAVTLFILLAPFAVLAPAAVAQTTSVSGQILRSDATPWPNLTVEILSLSTNEHHVLTTDKAGRYSQWGLRPGIYKISLTDKSDPSFSYSETHDLRGPAENDVSINFSKAASRTSGRPTYTNEEDAARFNAVKSHFNAATGAMQDAEHLRAQLALAADDQKTQLQQQLAADYQTAIEQLQQAEQSDPRLDAKTHAMILSHLANAYDFSGASADAISTYEKSVALSPDPVAYENLAKLQATLAVEQSTKFSTALDASDAFTSCTNSAQIDSATGAKCWKNLGIILDNGNHPSDAADAWRKLTALDANNAESWLHLGQSLLRTVEYNRDGAEAVPVFPPEAAVALKKCIAAAPTPTSSYAADARQLLAEMSAPH